ELTLPNPPVYDPATYQKDETKLPLHRVHSDKDGFGVDGVDVFIAGSGPIGATYARKLVDAGLSVVMCEMGATDTKPAAAHKKNEIEYQKDIDRFVNVIKGALSTVSVPTSKAFVDTLDPASWNSTEPFVTNGRNPRQVAGYNLSAQAVTRGTGGMATHWTCAVPHFLKGVERPVIHPTSDTDDDNEWKELYEGAGELVYRSETEFDECSIRHTLIMETLKETPHENPTNPVVPDDGHGPSSIPKQDVNVSNAPSQNGRVYKPLPLAARRLTNSPRYVEWSSAESVFGDLIRQQHVFNGEREEIGVPNDTPPPYHRKFRLLTNTRVTRYALSQEKRVMAVEVQDLLADRNNPGTANAPINFYIKAKYFVTCAGAVATPQILYNSGLNSFATDDKDVPPPVYKKEQLLPNLGKYITEQPMAFCQVVLKKTLVDSVPNNPWNLRWWQEAYDAHVKENEHTKCKDPLPFPRFDPEPQITTPVTSERPWHTQIHRDAFSYGAVAATIDSRLVCDFRWFGRTQPEETNRIKFERDLTDGYGMPQPTFHYQPNAESVREAHLMMTDMCEVAQRVGGYLPGSEPQFMAPGLALHLGGTTRLGHDDQRSCANFFSQVHGFPNCYVAGNGVIDTPFAANPTLTSMALAIYSAEHIADQEGKKAQFKRVVKRDRQPWPPKASVGA
ncbi:hypothetical protein FRC12_017624, partial [Ceratobasidium sp. 428]